MFNSRSETGDGSAGDTPECLTNISFVNEGNEQYAHLRKKWVEILSPFPFVAYGVYRGLTQAGTDVFYPSVVREPYSAEGEPRFSLAWENNSPVAIPHSSGMVLVPRTLEHISTRVAESGRIIIPSEKDVRGVLKEDSRMKRIIERNDPRAKRKMRDIAG